MLILIMVRFPRQPPSNRITPLGFRAMRRTGRLKQSLAIRLLRLMVAIVDEEQTATIEPIALQTVDDLGETIELVKQNRDMIHEKMVAIKEELGQMRREIIRTNISADVLILRDIRLRDMVPHLEAREDENQGHLKYV